MRPTDTVVPQVELVGLQVPAAVRERGERDPIAEIDLLAIDAERVLDDDLHPPVSAAGRHRVEASPPLKRPLGASHLPEVAQEVEHFEDGGLARPVGADEHDGHPARHLEREVLQRAEALHGEPRDHRGYLRAPRVSVSITRGRGDESRTVFYRGATSRRTS